MELKKYRLGDIAKVEISGIDKKSKEGQQDVLLCNFVDVYYNWAVTKDNESKFMPATASDSEIESFTLHKGQVAITKDSETRDDIGVATYIADDFDNLVVLGYHTALITPDEEHLFGKYLNALMHSSYFQRYWSNNASGSGQRYTLSQKVIEDAPVYLPDIDIQREIGEFFSDLDRKLCLNKKENEILEAMAKQIYDYWFVQFDFPDAKGRPYKSSGGKMVWNETLKREIPEGWEDAPLSETLDMFDYKRVPVSSKDRIKGEYPYYGATGIMDYVNDYIFDGEYILLAEDGSTNDGFDHPIVQFIWGKTWVNNHAHILRPKRESDRHFTYYLLKNIPLKNIESGSIQKKVSHDNLLKHKTLMPDSSIITRYCDLVSPFWDQYKRLTNEINILLKMREFILPLLMTGQVTIG